MRHRILLAVAVVFGMAVAVVAQNVRNAAAQSPASQAPGAQSLTDHQRIEQLERQVFLLSGRVATLEAEQSPQIKRLQ
jgi:uncharacterized protein YceH (UPF0502 family)